MGPQPQLSPGPAGWLGKKSFIWEIYGLNSFRKKSIHKSKKFWLLDFVKSRMAWNVFPQNWLWHGILTVFCVLSCPRIIHLCDDIAVEGLQDLNVHVYPLDLYWVMFARLLSLLPLMTSHWYLRDLVYSSRKSPHVFIDISRCLSELKSWHLLT